ncbi:hypothetical protein LEP1GSC170_2470 [Leptospira interrogans serovar Bataviae str. HAI135]|nr:hypothetical protein LEP1GSC170_2470 [Leptospira interrogans serovar Bataviae str. HAI135]
MFCKMAHSRPPFAGLKFIVIRFTNLGEIQVKCRQIIVWRICRYSIIILCSNLAASAFFGRLSFKIPFSYFAEILSLSIVSSKLKEREKEE